MQTKTYTPEFRAEAVKLVWAQGLSLEEAALRIVMPKDTQANWPQFTIPPLASAKSAVGRRTKG